MFDFLKREKKRSLNISKGLKDFFSIVFCEKLRGVTQKNSKEGIKIKIPIFKKIGFRLTKSVMISFSSFLKKVFFVFFFFLLFLFV